MASSRLERIGTIFTRYIFIINIITIHLLDIPVLLLYFCFASELYIVNYVLVNYFFYLTYWKPYYRVQMKLTWKFLLHRVEGLLLRGGMKPDDRPLWFDVYKAFPPLAEPKFARPKPDIKPIRQIFYQEDAIRA